MSKEEVFWFDEDENIIEDPEKAVKGVVRELDEDGNLIQETWLFPER